MKITGYVAKEKGTALVETQYDLPDITKNEVQVKVKYCGICHTDVSMIDDEWGISKYPMVAGHEIVGEVTEIGESVETLKVGDIVGIGWQSGSCGRCTVCRNGKQNICPHIQGLADTFGGFGEYVNVNATFAFKLPEGLDIAKVGPLLCGGITVYNPFEYYNVRPWMRVGVIGFGGLGHMAVKFARSFGAEVTVFSSSKLKEQDAKKAGATHFVTDISDESLTSTLDFIISTVPKGQDWDRYMKILRPEGKLCFVGVLMDKIEVDFFNLMENQKVMCAGSIGSPAMIDQMLEYVNRHQIYPEVEMFDKKDINVALDKVRKNEVKYRVVIEF